MNSGVGNRDFLVNQTYYTRRECPPTQQAVGDRSFVIGVMEGSTLAVETCGNLNSAVD